MLTLAEQNHWARHKRLSAVESGKNFHFFTHVLTDLDRSEVQPVIRVRLEASKGCHKVLDLAGRRGFAGFKVALNA
jgi:hypothetical protein